MKVSIITVCYNSQDTLEDAIHSVLNQDYEDIEYIIIDGKSSDGTLAIINTYQNNIAHWISEPDKGIYDAMNKGLEKATGDIIGILNSDDVYYDSSVISHVVKAFMDSKADTVYGDLNYVDYADVHLVKRRWVAGAYAKKQFLEGWMPPHPTFFVLREVYAKYGNFNTAFLFAADYELMLRILFKNGVSCAYLPQTLIRMRIGGASNASVQNRIKANQEDRKAWLINGVKPKWYTLYKKPISKMGQFFKRK